MILENLVALTNAKLISNPSITSVDGVAFRSNKVKRGNLFIALEHSEIEEAVLNGAYGIIFQGPTQINDTEIAWIKVESIDDALLRLMRFHLMEKELDVYECDTVTLKLSEQLHYISDCFILNRPLRDTAHKLWNIEKGTLLLYSSELINSDLFITDKIVPVNSKLEIRTVEQTLFETSFIFNNTYYERQLLSPFFIPYLNSLLVFLKQKKILFRIRPITIADHFNPVFINNDLQIKEFGSSDMVLIFESNISLIESQISFLQAEANWAKIIYIIPNSIKIKNSKINIFTYNTQTDIINILKNSNFHFALIADQNSSMLDLFQQDSKQLTLF